ncbi:unnamed protein product [Schistosoma margrebowiei]|uniref:Uncharacterized protein n=1 Tax=Schistosoma margrebowiei TaxID=48269 RepID=A0AA85AL92_9TREM|nr:unnamed protein product [Schistosoma margrebowiei]
MKSFTFVCNHSFYLLHKLFYLLAITLHQTVIFIILHHESYVCTCMDPRELSKSCSLPINNKGVFKAQF